MRSAWQRTDRQVANGQGADAAICIRGVLHGEVIGLATDAIYGAWSPRYAIPTLLDLYKQGKLKLDELITTRYTLDTINDAYQDMRDGRNMIPSGFAG